MLRHLFSLLILCLLALACKQVETNEVPTSIAPEEAFDSIAIEEEIEEMPYVIFVPNNLAQRLSGRIPSSAFYQNFRTTVLDSIFKFESGPFTIIALEEESAVDKLIYSNRNKKDSIHWLLRQVIPNRYTSPIIYQSFSAISDEFEVPTLSGESIRFKIKNDSLMVLLQDGNRLYLQTTDLEAENGVLHLAKLLD